MKKKDKRLAKTLEDRVGYVENRLASMGDDLGVVIGTLGDLQDTIERLGTDDREGIEARAGCVELNEPILITADQAKSMSDGGGWLMGYDRRNGWLFIGNPEYAPDDDGNGCWHDVRGNEVHGPIGG